MPLGPKINNLEDSNNGSYEITSFSEMTKYKSARKQIRVANKICPANSKHQIIDIKSRPWLQDYQFGGFKNGSLDETSFPEMSKYESAGYKN